MNGESRPAPLTIEPAPDLTPTVDPRCPSTWLDQPVRLTRQDRHVVIGRLDHLTPEPERESSILQRHAIERLKMEDEIAWPRPGMSLLKTTNKRDWRPNANMTWGPDWTLYQYGYAGAAKLLMRRTASGRDQDFLIYPILFTARHAIELGLKEIILCGNRLLDQDNPNLIRHDLRYLWKVAKPLLAEVEALHQPGASEEEATTAFEDLINELSAADPRSTTFRYPVDTDGRPSFIVGDSSGEVPRLINTRNLSHTLEAMFNFLDGVGTWLEAILEAVQEMRAEFLPNHEW